MSFINKIQSIGNFVILHYYLVYVLFLVQPQLCPSPFHTFAWQLMRYFSDIDSTYIELVDICDCITGHEKQIVFDA